MKKYLKELKTFSLIDLKWICKNIGIIKFLTNISFYKNDL